MVRGKLAVRPLIGRQPRSDVFVTDFECHLQNGTTEEDRSYGIAVDSDDTVVLTAYTAGGWGSSSSGEFDFAAVKLDENGVELWRWQVTQLDWCYGRGATPILTSTCWPLGRVTLYLTRYLIWKYFVSAT